MDVNNPIYIYTLVGFIGIFVASTFLFGFPLLYISFGARFGDLRREQVKKLFILFGIGAILMFSSATAFILLALFRDQVVPLFVWSIVLCVGVGAALLLIIYTYGLYKMTRWSHNYLDKYRQQKDNLRVE